MRRIVGIIAVAACAAFAAPAAAWEGGAVTHISCGQADVTLPAESGPWQFNIEEDGHPIIHGTSNGASPAKLLSIGVRASDNNEHAIRVWISNAADPHDGFQEARASFILCGPITGTPGPVGPTGPSGAKGISGTSGSTGVCKCKCKKHRRKKHHRHVSPPPLKSSGPPPTEPGRG